MNEWKRTNPHTYLLTKNRWATHPPTSQEIRDQIAKGYPTSRGQVMAAAYISHAMQDPANELRGVELWGRGRTYLSSQWDESIRVANRWSVWWWRCCHWPVWSNTRQYLHYTGSETLLYVAVNRELDDRTTLVYRGQKRFYTCHVPVRKPITPQGTFHFVTNNVPRWPTLNVTTIQRVNFSRQGKLMTLGIKGNYYMLNGNLMLSSKQARCLSYPFTSGMQAPHLHISPCRNWIAVTCKYGYAICAVRSQKGINFTLESDESIPKAIALNAIREYNG